MDLTLLRQQSLLNYSIENALLMHGILPGQFNRDFLRRDFSHLTSTNNGNICPQATIPNLGQNITKGNINTCISNFRNPEEKTVQI